jgi:replication factor C subunit 2/4
VREKVKTFAMASVGTATTPGYPCPQFKVIILDEADAMTKDAQAALRRTIESHAKATKLYLAVFFFLVVCTSRCRCIVLSLSILP